MNGYGTWLRWYIGITFVKYGLFSINLNYCENIG
jgi:hypothetical protein